MIKEKEIEVVLSGTNIPHYEKLGYEIPKVLNRQNKFVTLKNAKITVKVDDLPPTSQVMITTHCANVGCKKAERHLRYNNYKIAISDEVGLYYCFDCQDIKKEKIAHLKQQRGELKRGDKYYWKFRENVLKELHIHLSTYNTLINMSKINSNLQQAINKYFPYQLKNMVEELGYKYEELSDHNPYGFYNKQLIENETLLFIEQQKRFPTVLDCNTPTFKVPINQITKYFASLDNLRKLLNYTDVDQLIDNRGDINKSLFEIHVANWFIAQGLGDKYKREQFPFPKIEGRYKSDFTFYLPDDRELHVELWGYPKSEKDKRCIIYNENKNVKKKLY
jgi:signal recognition particle subunit SEC65